MISLVLSGFSITNYTEIAKARILTSFSVQGDPILNHNDSGGLESITLFMNFTINNPSAKELRVWILTFKAWLRDYPLESGLDHSRQDVDISFHSNDSIHWYYSIPFATYSYDQPMVILGAGENITLTEVMKINQTSDPDVVADIEGLLNSTNDAGNEPEWVTYGSAILFIQGVPSYSGPEKDANVIRLSQGMDLSVMNGGTFP